MLALLILAGGEVAAHVDRHNLAEVKRHFTNSITPPNEKLVTRVAGGAVRRWQLIPYRSGFAAKKRADQISADNAKETASTREVPKALENSQLTGLDGGQCRYRLVSSHKMRRLTAQEAGGCLLMPLSESNVP